MDKKKYRVEQVAPRIDEFLRSVAKDGRFHLKWEIVDGVSAHPEIEDPEILVKFSGADVELLLDNKAELLLALEHLTMEVLGIPPEDHVLMRFDANDYRALRIEELRLSASAAADKVRRTGQPFKFNPMTSRERRILHLALRDEQGVRSESLGMGAHRQVVIYPQGMPSLPEPGPEMAPRRDGPGRRPRRR